MTKVAKGNTVEVHYKVALEDGTVVDASEEKLPFQFVIGNDDIIQGFQDAVIGMQIGEAKKVTVPAEKAYGPYRKNFIVNVKKDILPEGLDLSVGKKLQVTKKETNEKQIVTIVDIGESTITIDTNHPLAGKNLLFEIKLLNLF